MRRAHPQARQRGAQGSRRTWVHMGRKPKLTEHQRGTALARMRAGESARAIARDMGVAHTTINRVAG